MAVSLDEAIAAARQCYPGDEWLLLSPGEQTRMIYLEMRRLDLERTRALPRPQGVDLGNPPAQHPSARQPSAGATPITLCQAQVRSRSTGRCGWKATVMRNGVAYCGFHARLDDLHKLRSCAAAD